VKSQNRLLIDAHSDILIDVIRKRTLGKRRVIEKDWAPRMKKGGIDTRVLAIYIDAAFLPEMALRKALDLVSALLSEVNESTSMIICTSSKDIEYAKENGNIGLVLGMEGAEPLANDIDLLQIFHKLGLRVLTLTHSRRNYAADGSFTLDRKTGKPGGLTDFGIALLKKAYDLGIVVDVSHLNNPGFWDVVENAESSIIASHSNCRSLCDDPRNLTDQQIEAIAEREGVVCVTAVPTFVDKNRTDVERLLNHVDHIVNIAGVETVGLGFDFYEYLLKYMSDEEKARLPQEALSFSSLNDITKDEDVPNVTNSLAKRGYTDRDIELILGRNLLRVFKKVCDNKNELSSEKQRYTENH
jgi:membrane dipeptidase